MSTLHSTSPAASVIATNPREQRGRAIADAGRIRERDGLWLVPSQSGSDTYTVGIRGESMHCTCPDHEVRRVTCKHIYAVQYTISRTTTETTVEPDGTATTTTTTTVAKKVRVTYKQDWPAYNLVQTHEGEWFGELPHGLCAGIVTPRQDGPGRPRAALSDVVFSAVLKVYSTMSGRRRRERHTRVREQGLHRQGPVVQLHLQVPGESRLNAHPQGDD